MNLRHPYFFRHLNSILCVYFPFIYSTNIKDPEFPLTQASRFSIKKYDLNIYVIMWWNSYLILSFVPPKIVCNRNTQIFIKELITCNIWITRETTFIISNWTRITEFVQNRNKIWFNKQLKWNIRHLLHKTQLLTFVFFYI